MVLPAPEDGTMARALTARDALVEPGGPGRELEVAVGTIAVPLDALRPKMMAPAGPGERRGRLVRWLVEPSQDVRRGEPLAEIEGWGRSRLLLLAPETGRLAR